MEGTIEIFENLRTELINHHDATKGSIFGHKGLKVLGKVFVFYNEPNIVVKLRPVDVAEALKLSGAKNFDPMGGKPMKEWVEIPHGQDQRWFDYSMKAMGYVKSLIK
ncbi:hypothetical protein [Gottfriedia luciferensis]|uniref:hypothetical protein n=1 Tax=Gottfriedia luciferensis TaxID=178774 RepID=UPI000B450E40|nr:hypothetical protein [Gottfriedia luciferensis]